MTRREREALALVREGLTSREIAVRLGVGADTVDSHIKSATGKLDVGSRRQAALAASGLAVEPQQPERPPLVIVDPAAVGDVAAALRRGGYTVRTGLDLPPQPWQLRGTEVVVAGEARSRGDAVAVLSAAARGAGVVVGVALERAALARLLDDLRRIGPVDWRVGKKEPLQRLDAAQRRVLELLAEGASLNQAAEALSYSPRTVSRKLAAARAALDVETTAEAVRLIREL